MRRRVRPQVRLAMVASLTLALAGGVAACAGVLGLEDRTLEGASPEGSDGAPSSSDTESGTSSSGGGADAIADVDAGEASTVDPPRQDAEAFDVGPVPDAGPDAPPGPCDGTSVPVYEFSGGDSRWRYSTSATAEGGETAYGPLFKTFSTAYGGSTMPIYVVANSSTLDTAVTYRSDEGAGAGYSLVGTLGIVNNKNAAAPPGTLMIVRYYREAAPTRHRLFVNSTAPTLGQWSIEANVFYACPAQ